MAEAACPICDRIALWRAGKNAHFIHEFRRSIFVVGDHQFYKGYSLILLKKHVREMHELSLAAQSELFQEVMTAGRALVAAFRPWKMNYSCYGNAVPHIHWHLFPRYAEDPDRVHVPWRHSEEFKAHRIDDAAAQALAAEILARGGSALRTA